MICKEKHYSIGIQKRWKEEKIQLNKDVNQRKS